MKSQSPAANDSVERSIQSLRGHKIELQKRFPIEMMMGAFALDLESRRSDPTRQFKHIHQMCVMATMDLKVALMMRTLLLVDCYLALLDAKAGLGLHGIVRGMIELHGLTRRVLGELLIVHSGSKSDWKSRGERFHRYIIRARFGTRDAKLAGELTAKGVPKKALEPFHSNDCIDALCDTAAFSGVRECYETLCDFTHPNVRGNYEGSPGFLMKKSVSLSGWTFLARNEGPVTLYEYPSKVTFDKSVSFTAAIMNEHVEGLLGAVGEIPSSPYRVEEVMTHTQSTSGFTGVGHVTSGHSEKVRINQKLGRNNPCPCGSGKKFKNCCMRSP